MNNLENELCSLLNRYCNENQSNTPDFILANYLVNCLDAFHKAVNARSLFWNQSYPSSFITKELQINK